MLSNESSGEGGDEIGNCLPGVPIKLVTLALDEVTAIEIYRTAIKLAELLLEQLRPPADPFPPVASPDSI